MEVGDIGSDLGFMTRTTTTVGDQSTGLWRRTVGMRAGGMMDAMTGYGGWLQRVRGYRGDESCGQCGGAKGRDGGR